MLHIVVPAMDDGWDEIKQEFVSSKECNLQLEHSLISLSKWESQHCKPFLTKQEHSQEETLDYIRCMTLTQNVDPNVYYSLTAENISTINAYIESPMTATFFYDDRLSKKSREQITSEIIYYWMVALNIPFECQKWHLNRLLTLIRVCNIKNQPAKKRSRKEIMSRNAALNEIRRKQLNSRG